MLTENKMEITTDKIGNFVELRLSGRLDTNTSQQLEKELIDIINKGEDNIIVNFSDLNYISSSGLRVFLVAAKMLDAKGKKLNFCEMRDFIREVFDIAGFSIIFNIADKKEDLLQ